MDMTKKHIGSSFDNFLEEEGLLVDAQSTAAQRVAKKVMLLSMNTHKKRQPGKKIKVSHLKGV